MKGISHCCRACLAILSLVFSAVSATMPEPVPPWYSSRPTAPKGSNYFYAAGSGTGISESAAKDKAWLDAQKNASRTAGLVVYGNDGSESMDFTKNPRREICNVTLIVSPSEYKAYVLYKVKLNYLVNKDDYLLDDGSVICGSTAFYAQVEKFNSRQHSAEAKAIAQKSNYYESKIEAVLRDAEHTMKLADESIKSDNRRDALGKLESVKKSLNSLDYYRDSLIIIDSPNALERLPGERIDKLRQAHNIALSEFKGVRVYVKGSDPANIVIPKLLALISENERISADSEDDADYIIEANAEIYDTKFDSRIHYSYARVEATLINNKTGKREDLLNIDGPKGRGMKDRDRADREAYNAVIPKLWDKLKDKF